MTTQRHQADVDLVVRLNYVDKIFVASQRVEASFSRLLAIQAVLSLLLLALTTGLVSAGEDLELSGIKLKLPLWTLIGGVSVAVGVISTMSTVQDVHAARLRALMQEAYDQLGYVSPREREA